jgi:hypothetical protein
MAEKYDQARSAVLAGAVWRGFDGPDGVTKDEALHLAGEFFQAVEDAGGWTHLPVAERDRAREAVVTTMSDAADEQLRNVQDAPYPTILAGLVERLRLDPGWRVWLSEETRDTGSPEQGHGLTLTIGTLTFDTYHPELGRRYAVLHTFAVPPATYNEQSWTRWLFERYVDVLRHEGMEFFRIMPECDCGERGYTGYGAHEPACPVIREEPFRPYAPNHGPGNDPYVVRELTTDVDRRTQFTGNVDHR